MVKDSSWTVSWQLRGREEVARCLMFMTKMLITAAPRPHLQHCTGHCPHDGVPTHCCLSNAGHAGGNADLQPLRQHHQPWQVHSQQPVEQVLFVQRCVCIIRSRGGGNEAGRAGDVSIWHGHEHHWKQLAQEAVLQYARIQAYSSGAK